MVHYLLNSSLRLNSSSSSFFFFLGVVKKMTGGFFKIVHEKYRAKNADDQIDAQVRQMQEIVRLYPELKSNIQRSVVSF